MRGGDGAGSAGVATGTREVTTGRAVSNGRCGITGNVATGVDARRAGELGVDGGRLRMNADFDVMGRVITNGWLALSLQASVKRKMNNNEINNIKQS